MTTLDDALTPQKSEPIPASPRTWLNTIRIMRDQQKFYHDLFERYGDTARVSALNGEVVATRDPELIRQIFAQSPDLYDPFAVDTMRPLVGQGSLLVISGAEHKRGRKMLMPPFHGERMKAYGELIRERARAHLARFEVGQAMTLSEVMADISLDVIVRVVFGVVDEERAAPLAEALREMVGAISPMIVFSKAMQRSFFGLGPWETFQRHVKRAKALLDEEIDRKLEGDLGEDILSLLLQTEDEQGQGFEREELHGHLFTLLLAGHETTALSLAWAMYHLLSHPEALERLCEELDDSAGEQAEAIAKLPYVQAVINETLRLYPIVPDVLRALREPLRLGPYEVAAGEGVDVAIMAVHHDERVFERPMEFLPERFLERRYKPWEFMPFGGGHRRCIGAALASFEMAIVLAEWIGAWEFELLDERVEPKRRGITIGPDTGVRVRLTGRRGSAGV